MTRELRDLLQASARRVRAEDSLVHGVFLGSCGHLANLGLHRARALRCIRSSRFPKGCPIAVDNCQGTEAGAPERSMFDEWPTDTVDSIEKRVPIPTAIPTRTPKKKAPRPST